MQFPFRLVIFAVALTGLGAALLPWSIGGAHVRSGLATQITQATGWRAQVTGPITLKLLPRPRVQLSSLSVDDGRGAFRVDAVGLYGDLDVAALLSGRWRLTSATLVEPTVTLDAQRVEMGSVADGPSEEEGAAPSAGAASGMFKLALRGGLIRLTSNHAGADTLITDINATAERDTAEGSLTLAGTAVWHATNGQFAGRIEHAADFLRGEETATSLEVVSPLGAFLASGEVSRRNGPQFIGHLAVSTPSLPGLLRAFDLESSSLTVGRGLLSGDVVARMGDVSLSNIRLRLDQTVLEGTLAYRNESGTPLIEGTLATDRLDLDRLAGALKSAAAVRHWYVTPFDPASFATNVDLRVSAASSRIGRVDFEDAALSILMRNGQMEATLDEARAFEGTIKARALARMGAHGLEGHADLSVTGIELGPLSSVVAGQEKVSGTMMGHVTLDGRGTAMVDVVRGLSGQGQLTVQNGNFLGLSVTQALRRFSRKLPLGLDPSGQITTFDSATSSFSVENGVVNIVEGQVSGPGMQMRFGGRTDLQGGRIQLKALAAATDAGGTVPPGTPRLPLEMRGNWGGPFKLVEHSTGVELPDFQWPFSNPPHDLH
jgi:AsmA protein